MALVSPGVEVTVIDQSQYLPAPTNSIPLIVVASAQDKANASGTGVAAYTTAATANKLYQIVSQRDLVNFFGVPRFYRTSAGTPINGYELNEYGLQAAYSALGVTNRVYVMRADIDLSALTASLTRPSAPVADGTLWMNTASSTWGIYEFNATTGKFTNMLPRVLTDNTFMSGGAPVASFGNIGDYAVYTDEISNAPDVGKQYFYKTTDNVWVTLGSDAWKLDLPTVQGSVSNPVLTPGETFTMNVGGLFSTSIAVPVAPNNTVLGVATAINNLGWTGLSAAVRSGKLCIFMGLSQTDHVTLAEGSGVTPLADMGIVAGTYYAPEMQYGTSAQMPLWTSSQAAPRPSGSVWIKVGSAGSGLMPVVSRYSTGTASWQSRSVSLAASDWNATALLDTSGGQAIPEGTLYAQYDYNYEYNQGPVYLFSRSATGPTVVTGTTTNFQCSGPYPIFVQVSVPGSSSLSSVYRVDIANNATPSDFVSSWAAAGIPYTLAAVTSSGALELTHTEGGEIILNDYVNGVSSGLLATIGFVVGTTPGVKYGPGVDTTKSLTVLATEATTNYVTVASTGQLAPGGVIGFTSPVGALPTVATTGSVPLASTALTITGSTAGIVAGMLVTGPSITVTTYVSTIVGSAVTLSAAPTAAGSGTYSFSAAGLVPGVNYTVGLIIDSTRFTVIDPVTTAVVPLATTSGGMGKASAVEQTSTNGAGTGATFDISAEYGKYVISGDGVARGGLGYAVGDQITFAGTVLGGATPANDLVVEVTANTAATGSGIIGFKGAGALATAVMTASATTVTNAVFTASIAGSTMTVTSVASGTLAIGQTLVGTGIVPGTYIISAGGPGQWNLNQASPVGSIIITSVTTTMTVTENIGAGGARHIFGFTTDKVYGTGTGIVGGSIAFADINQDPVSGLGSIVLSGTPVSFSSQKIYVVNVSDTGAVLDVTSWTAGVLGAPAALVTPGGATDIAGTVASQVSASNSPVLTTTAIGLVGATNLSVANVSGIAVGQFVSGTGVAANTKVIGVNATTKVVTISAALSAAAVGGTYSYSFRSPGNTGIYLLNAPGTTTPQQAVPPTLIKQASSLMTILSLTSGAFGVGQLITGFTPLAPTPATIASLGSGTGGTGTYNLLASNAQFAETTMFADLGKAGAITYVSGTPATPTAYNVQCSNWELATYIPSATAPVSQPKSGALWYYSTPTEADIMVQKNGQWIGYRNTAFDSTGAPKASGTNATDANGPIFSTNAPSKQSDGTTALQYGDLWVDTSAEALENYPQISRWQSVSGTDQWVLINNADSVSSSGIVFADARWGGDATVDPVDDAIPTIKSMLTSNWLDPDAPNPSLYPQGTLLFNSRRSGYNVKRFTTNLFTVENYPSSALPTASYTWVTASGNKGNGAPYSGRKAQRAMVVQALKAAIDTNSDIRDEDNAFNLIAVPGYPELQPNMIALNSDRGETAFIIGDTPMRLQDNATVIQNWATNAAGATTTGEDGCVNRSEYMGLFYPSGMSNDLNGNDIVVPASHMMIRTFLRNDIIAYPWLAAAGTRRGTIDNASSIGYINAETGEFMSIKTRIGIRDVLYTNQINPLVFFTGVGLLNYGNKTSKNTSSAMDRTNVARLVAYVRRQLTLAARPFIFEPNDALTRSEISGVVRSLFIEIAAKRGIYDYLVVCDESNNTPARIDRNELWIDVAIEPVKAVEFIYIPVRILNTGELSA